MTVLGEGDFKEVIKVNAVISVGPSPMWLVSWPESWATAPSALQHPPEVGTVVLPTFQARKRRLEKPGNRLWVTKLGRSRA